MQHECCFRFQFCTGPGTIWADEMIFAWIMFQVQDRSLDLLTCSPVYYHCAIVDRYLLCTNFEEWQHVLKEAPVKGKMHNTIHTQYMSYTTSITQNNSYITIYTTQFTQHHQSINLSITQHHHAEHHNPKHNSTNAQRHYALRPIALTRVKSLWHNALVVPVTSHHIMHSHPQLHILTCVVSVCSTSDKSCQTLWWWGCRRSSPRSLSHGNLRK